MAKKKGTALLDAAEIAIKDLLSDEGLELEQRLSVIDRAIKIETLRNKIDDAGEGSMFGDED